MTMLSKAVRREIFRLGQTRRAFFPFATQSFSTTEAPRRRLRRLKPQSSRLATEFKMPDLGGLGEAFEPKEPMDKYLEKVSLSPWVPTPDPVARRALELLKATKEDVHVDLGSGDGRMNFHASDAPFSVKRSVGIDIDTEIMQVAQDRLSKRHPKPLIEFHVGDLKDSQADVWKEVTNATIMTMYFVKEALEEIQPHLERALLGKKCRVATVGYAMPRTSADPTWDPVWVEVILGTPIHIYEMGYPTTHRLTPPDVAEPVTGSASEIELQEGRQPFNDEYADVERVPDALFDPDDFKTEADEDWSDPPPEPQKDDGAPTWRAP